MSLGPKVTLPSNRSYSAAGVVNSTSATWLDITVPRFVSLVGTSSGGNAGLISASSSRSSAG